MAQLFDNNVTKKSKFLLHCRPRLLFHLGHLRMLNILYEILEKGHEVVILIIPCDEHEQNNQTIKNRLQEEINITKAFYSNYLGFNEVQLKIISTFDIPVDKNRLGEIQKKYSELFQLESSKVKKMIDDKNNVYIETDYEGYGVFGGVDFYPLLDKMNGGTGDRVTGVGKEFGFGIKRPKIVSIICEKRWEELEDNVDCEYQGYFYPSYAISRRAN